MPANPVRLSICIATYNRGPFIGETIDSILPQLAEGMELLIVDGASTDDTQQVVTEYASRTPAIRYVRLDRKGGVDQDFDTAVGLARGEYCWLFTDDDLMKPGAVAAVTEATGKGYSLVVVNCDVWNKDFSRQVDPTRMSFEEDRAYPPGDDARLFLDTAGYISFIGGVVIRKALWMERLREPYYGTEFIHVGVIFQKPLPAGAYAIAFPYISVRHENAQWSPRSFHIWAFKWPDLVWSFVTIPDSVKNRVFRKEPWRNPAILSDHRARGAYSLEEYRKWILPRTHAIRERVLPYLIARTPALLLNIIAEIYLMTLGRGRSPLVLDGVRSSRRNMIASMKRSKSNGSERLNR